MKRTTAQINARISQLEAVKHLVPSCDYLEVKSELKSLYRELGRIGRANAKAKRK